jgi:hypothetical protein
MAKTAHKEPRSISLRVRITKRLHDELTKLAAEDHRTVSAYCELLLERAVEESKRKMKRTGANPRGGAPPS